MKKILFGVITTVMLILIACASGLSEDTQRACNNISNLYVAVDEFAEEVSGSGNFRLDVERGLFNSGKKLSHYQANVMIWNLKPAYRDSATFDNSTTGPGYDSWTPGDDHNSLKGALCSLAVKMVEDFGLSGLLPGEVDNDELNAFFANAFTVGKKLSADNSLSFSNTRLTAVGFNDNDTHFLRLRFSGVVGPGRPKYETIEFPSWATSIHEAVVDIGEQFEKQHPGMWE